MPKIISYEKVIVDNSLHPMITSKNDTTGSLFILQKYGIINMYGSYNIWVDIFRRVTVCSGTEMMTGWKSGKDDGKL